VSSTSLIDAYLQELETYLPRDLRQSVRAKLEPELEAAVESALEFDSERSRHEAELEVLRDLGPPYQLADTYVPRPRVLFGPRLYPPFLRTIRIAIAVLVVLTALGIYLDFTRSQSLWALGPAFLAALGSLLTGSLVVIGVAVVVFAVIERTTVRSATAIEDWDPRTLEEAANPDNVKLGDQISGIAFLIVALIVVNVFRDRLGAHVTWEGESGWVPLLGPVFDQQLWLLNLALSLDLLVKFTVLLRWRWSWPLRWANLSVNALYVVWLGRLAWNPPLIAVDPQWMIDHGWSAETAHQYQEFIAGSFARHANVNLKLAFAIACLALAYSLVKLVYRFATRS
jgi:hypothetical protein